MRSRTFLRVFVGYVAVSLLAVLIFAFYTLRLAGTMSFDALTRGLEGAALTARVSVMPLLSQGRSAQLDALVVAMGKEGSVRFTVIDPQGVVLADSQENAAAMENHSLRPEVSKALLGTTGISLRLSSTVGRRMVYVAVPVLSSTGVVQGVVRTATYPEQLQQAALRNSGGLALFSTILRGMPPCRAPLFTNHQRTAGRPCRRGGKVLRGRFRRQTAPAPPGRDPEPRG
jgi:two-component system, OmpR family, phosphate regulon sensor histidine kinase PhoR